MKAVLLAFSALITGMIPGTLYSADSDKAELIRLVFVDEPGTYKIRLSITHKDDKTDHVKPIGVKELDAEGRFSYEQKPKGEYGRDCFADFIEIPHNAKRVRLSIRKKGYNGAFNRGGWKIFDAKALLHGTIACKKISNKAVYSINVFDQFEALAQGNNSGINTQAGMMYTYGFDEQS